MDLLPSVTDLARHAAEVLGHEVRARARPSIAGGRREVFVEISTLAASTSDELIRYEEALTDWLLETYPEAGIDVTVYLKRS